jgi:phage gpG-like protein
MIKITLKNLPRIMQDQALVEKATRRAIKRAGERYHRMIHDYIDARKAFTPRTGQLQRSINIRFERFSAIISVNTEYAPYVEYGTRPHTIMPRNRKALKIPTRDGFIFRKRVSHPGSKPYPYFFADFENRIRAVEEEFRNAFLEELM